MSRMTSYPANYVAPPEQAPNTNYDRSPERIAELDTERKRLYPPKKKDAAPAEAPTPENKAYSYGLPVEIFVRLQNLESEVRGLAARLDAIDLRLQALTPRHLAGRETRG